MGKVIAVLLGLAVIAFAAKVALDGTRSSAAEASAPKRQLDDVRAKARRIEREAQKNADDVARKAGTE